MISGVPRSRRKIGDAERARLAEIGRATRFVPGVVTNPTGRPKLPEEIRKLKEATLEKAIVLFHDKIHNEDWTKEAEARDLLSYLESAFDRLGMPKVSKSETKSDVTIGISQTEIDEVKRLIDTHRHRS